MFNKAQSITFKTASDFFKDAEECNVIDDLFEGIEDRYSKTILNDAQLRRLEDWSDVAMQVVGSESLSNSISAE